MAQAVCSRPLTEKSRVRSQVSPYGVCGGQNATGQVFLRAFRFPLSVSFRRVRAINFCTFIEHTFNCTMIVQDYIAINAPLIGFPAQPPFQRLSSVTIITTKVQPFYLSTQMDVILLKWM